MFEGEIYGLHGRTCQAGTSVLFERAFVAVNVKPSQPHFVQHCLGAFMEKQHPRVSSFSVSSAFYVQIHEWEASGVPGDLLQLQS